jgi:hypothetical protein
LYYEKDMFFVRLVAYDATGAESPTNNEYSTSA